MRKIYRSFQIRKTFIIYAFFVLAIFMFITSFLVQDVGEWWSNLLMGVGASCLASVLFAIVTDIPNYYRKLKEDNDVKMSIIRSYYKNIDLARQYFEKCMDAEKYDYAIGQIWYLHEKCSALASVLESKQINQNMLQKDETIRNYCSEFDKAEKQFFVLRAEIEVEGQEFVATNPRCDEFVRRMTEIVAHFYDNYMNIYMAQLDEAAEIERIKNKNRY